MPERSTVQVAPETHARLRQLSEERHESMSDVVEWLINFEAETQFWADFNAGYAALRADPVAWAEEQAERALWDTTMADGLRDE